jgi:hypothetical protein
VRSGRWWQSNQKGEVRKGRLASAVSEPVETNKVHPDLARAV